jgi:oligosaccharide repeat unit polymerase
MSITIAIVASVLTAAFASTLAVNLRRGHDPFSPWCLVPGLHLLRTSPYLFLVSTDPEAYVHPSLVEAFPDLDAAFLWYGFVELLGFACCLLGISVRGGAALANRLPILRYRMSPQTLEVAGLGAVGIGLAAYAVILSQVGGLGTLLDSLDRRVEVLEGLGYLTSLVSLAAVGTVFLAYSLKFSNTPRRITVVVCLALATATMFSTTGGRKLALGLLLSLLIVWHWAVRPIRRPVRLAIIVCLMVAPYFIAMPLIRSNRGSLDTYAERPLELVADVLDNSSNFITHLSYCDIYVFVTNHFTVETIWMGQTYLDLLKAPVPRRFLPDKPPIDEGLYMYTMAQGAYVYPGMPSRDQGDAGWPTETLGTMYWNFHLPGVMFGMGLLGMIMRMAYTYVLRSDKSLYSLILYQAIMFGFALSNIRIVQLSMILTTVTGFFAMFLGARLIWPSSSGAEELAGKTRFPRSKAFPT